MSDETTNLEPADLAALLFARDVLDEMLGDTDLAGNTSPEFRACRALSEILQAAPSPIPPNPNKDRLIAAIRAFTVDAKDEAGEPVPNSSTHETALDLLCEHPYMLGAPSDVAILFGMAMTNQASDCQELREAAEAYFGGDF